MSLSGDSLLEMMGGRGEGMGLKITPTDIKVVIEREEKEYEAFLAATDSKVKLAFIKIEDLGDRKLAAVDFGSPVDVAIGQTVVGVGRQKKGYDYAPFVEWGRVTGEIAKPRKAWMVDGTISGVGLPAFTAGGQVIGALTNISDGMKDDEDGGGGGMGLGRMMRFLRGGGGGGGELFILPGSVVKGLIGQAKAKAVEVAAERAKQKEEEKKEGAAKKDEPKEDKGGEKGGDNEGGEEKEGGDEPEK
jgi:hypothetical protein